MSTISTTIQGTSSLLMHRFGEAGEIEATTRRVHVQKEDPREAAERTAYRLPDGGLYIPGAAIARLLREAGSAMKQRGSRKTLKYVIPSAVLISAEALPLHDVGGTPLTAIEVDSRPVTIPATKGRIMRHRARLNDWRATFDIEIDDTMLDPDTVHELLVDGGRKLGIGDFRPERGGPFGRFSVIAWTDLSIALKAAA